MSFTRLTDNLNIIQALEDEPNASGGLTAAQLKAKFDEAVNIVKDYLNDTFIAEIESGGKANSIGITLIPGLTGATDVQTAFETVVEMMQGITQGSVADGSITTAKLAASSVSTAKIADAAVSTDKLAASAVETGKIKDSAVETAKINDAAVTASKLASSAVTTTKIDNSAVTTAKIADSAVGTAKLDTASVTTAKLAGASVTAEKIAANAVSNLYTATIGTNWTGSAAPYSQTITVAGLLASDTPVMDIVPSDTFSTAEQQLDEYGYIFKAVAGEDSLTVYATEPTTVSISVQLKVVRK